MDKKDIVPYIIKLRKNLDKDEIHRIQFEVQVSDGIKHEQFIAIGQKIVRKTLAYEFCHGITIDFGNGIRIDFAPYGNWAKAGEVPINNYQEYDFNYFFPSSN